MLIEPTPKHGTFFCVDSLETVRFNVTAVKYNATTATPSISIITGAMPAGSTVTPQIGAWLGACRGRARTTPWRSLADGVCVCVGGGGQERTP